MNTIKIALITVVTMLFLDGIWLGLIAKNMYFENLKHLARHNPAGNGMDVLYGPAAIVYVFMLILFMVFVTPVIFSKSFPKMIVLAWAFGFLVYGVYDFTNMATLRDWPLALSLLDMAWGGVVYATASAMVKVAYSLGFVQATT